MFTPVFAVSHCVRPISPDRARAARAAPLSPRRENFGSFISQEVDCPGEKRRWARCLCCVVCVLTLGIRTVLPPVSRFLSVGNVLYGKPARETLVSWCAPFILNTTPSLLESPKCSRPATPFRRRNVRPGFRYFGPPFAPFSLFRRRVTKYIYYSDLYKSAD